MSDHTPLKINMEHNNGGLEDHFPLKKWVVFRFQPLIFEVVHYNETSGSHYRTRTVIASCRRKYIQDHHFAVQDTMNKSKKWDPLRN